MNDHTHGIYLDHAATTALDERVLEAMMPYLTTVNGNPASLHREGRLARRGIEQAREQVASVLGIRPRQVTFTSGATEADNLAVKGVMAGRRGALVTSSVEHAAVLHSARVLEAAGRAVTYLEPDASGVIATASIVEALEGHAAADGTAVVALMYVNNETGVLTDVASVASAAHDAGAVFVCDSVQAAGVEELAMHASGADIVTLSAHKINGPKGVGVLARREGVEVEPQTAGGAQEAGIRPGTHAVSAIVGMGAALELAESQRATERLRLRGLQAELEAACLRIPGVAINGAGARRSVRHSNVRVDGVDGEALLMALDDAGVYVSAGSACAAGSLEPSHVLMAMGLTARQAKASVRFSLGRETNSRDVAEAASRFAAVVGRCRAATG